MPSISRWSDDCEATSTTVVTSASDIERSKACAHTNTMMNQSNETSALIRDDIQSHNGDSCTNVRAPSVFASVSPFQCHNVQRERCSEDAHILIPLNSAEENDNSLLRATSTNDPPVTGNTSVAAASTPVKQSLSNFATRLNTGTGTGTPVRGQIKTHVPIGSIKSLTEKSIQLPPHQTKVKKRKRIPNDSTPVNNSNDDSNLDSTNNTTQRYSSSGSTGRWTTQEHQAFVRGLALYGREWKRVAMDIPTRTSAQVRSHAQKYLSKMEKQLSLSHSGNVHFASDIYNIDTVAPSASQKSNDPTYDHDYTMATAQSPPTTRLASHSHDSETSPYEDGSPTAGSQQHDTENDYQTMTDSVRQQAARILANPTTVEQEVRDTISQLRVRYLQLQERIQQQQHQHEASASIDTDNGNSDQSRNIILHRPVHDGVEHNIIERSCDNNITIKVNSTNDNNSISNSNAIDFGNTNKSSSSNTSSASAQGILYVHHDDDELIALHVLQGLQKQQLRI